MIFYISEFFQSIQEGLFGSRDLPEPRRARCTFVIRRLSAEEPLNLSFGRHWQDEEVFQAYLPVEDVPKQGELLCMLLKTAEHYENYQVQAVIKSVFHQMHTSRELEKMRKEGRVLEALTSYRIYIKQI